MLVCHCHRVNDRVIRDAVQNGARSCDDIGALCGAGTGCGGCRPLIEGLVLEERASRGAGPIPMVMAPEEGV